jgi:hypothetical protein
MNAVMENDCADWVEVTAEEKKTIKKELAKATPSPKIFTMRDDGNNAPSSFAEPNRKEVCDGAKDSVSFLKASGFVRG